MLAAAIIGVGACRTETSEAPEGLVVVNAPVAGKVLRVLVSEGTNVPEKAALIEIAVVSNVAGSAANENRRLPQNTPNAQTEIKSAEEDLQRASIELQRIEPLVTSGSAPQAHLDAARAQYQQAQERIDRLSRQPQNAPQSITAQKENAAEASSSSKENIVAVPAPASGNVRVISVRSGQFVKAGETIATISTEQ